MSDVVPRESRRSIRNVTLSRGKKEIEGKLPLDRESQEYDTVRNIRSRRRKIPRFVVWISIAVLAVLVLVVFSTLLGGATVTLTPKSERISVQTTFTANRGIGDNTIGYETLPLSEVRSQTVPSEGEKQVERQASGVITVYNNYSSAPQRLIKNTRFESPNGLIYRIPNSITVPGRVSDGSGIRPGSIDVTVYADSAGDEYNSPPIDLTIPGFEDSPERYQAFYARAKSGFSGGFVGVEKVVDEDKKEEVVSKLRNDLRQELIKQAKVQVPDGFILYESAIEITFSSEPDTQKGDTVTLNERGNLTGYLLKRDDISGAIISTNSVDLGKGKAYVSNLEKLNLSVSSFPKDKTGDFIFSMEGEPIIVWNIDEALVQDVLAGESKKEAKGLLSGFDSISNTRITISPFWKTTFPKEGESIKIKIEGVN